MTVYQCQTCSKWWVRPEVVISCTVYHSGGCCHFGEVESQSPAARTRDRLERMATGYFG